MSAIEIPLTQGQIALIDSADAELVSLHKWHAVKTNWTFYAATNINSKRVYMHRFLLGLAGGREIVVDHRNHDGLDNRRANIRACSQAINMLNRRNRRSNPDLAGTSRNGDGWIAKITIGGNRIVLGTFSTEHEAGIAYAAAKRTAESILGGEK